jgi:hypothetical protein
VTSNVVPFRRDGGARFLIDRLQRVSKVGEDRWRAVCPAHESKHRTQSLSVRETRDGTVLIKCFAGCGAADIMAAVGLQVRDLFASDYRCRVETESHGPQATKSGNHWHSIRQAVQTLKTEVLIAAIAANDVAEG